MKKAHEAFVEGNSYETKKAFKLSAVLLLILCFVILLMAFSRDGEEEKALPAISDNSDYGVTVSLLLTYIPSIPKDVEMIEQKLNELVGEKLKINLNLIYCNQSEEIDTIRLCEKKGIDIDIVRDKSNYDAFFEYIALDDLIEEYLPDVPELYREGFLDSMRVNGKIYKLPSLADSFMSLGLAMRTETLNKYGIDVSTLNSIGDINGLFETLHENEPEMSMIAPSSTLGTMMYKQQNYRSVPNSLCEVSEDGIAMNYFATPEYVEWIYQIYEWNQKGYLPELGFDANISAMELLLDGDAFSYFCTYKPGIEVEQESISTGLDLTVIQLQKQMINNSSNSTGAFGITSQCTHPENAAQFLNLLFTDPEIVNLLTYGIEGVHYKKLPDGTIDFPNGITAETCGYAPTIGWYFPNQFLTYVRKGDSPELWKEMREFIDEADMSNTIGFIFDPEPVSVQNEALYAVSEKYQYGIENGILDPDVYLPKLYAEMESAGIEDVIEEMQRQYDAFLLERGVEQ